MSEKINYGTIGLHCTKLNTIRYLRDRVGLGLDLVLSYKESYGGTVHSLAIEKYELDQVELLDRLEEEMLAKLEKLGLKDVNAG